MKKILTTVCILLGAYSFTRAQTTQTINAGKTEIGFGLGINGAYITQNAEYSSSTGLIWGFTAHISAEQYLNDQFGIKIKAIYDPKGLGNGFRQDNAKTVTGVYFPLKYISVPVTLNWHFGPEKNWYAMAGPYVGFLLSATDDYDHENLKSQFKSTDVGADLGLGVQFPVSEKLKMFFEYDGQLGFTNILANSASGADNVRSGFNIGLKF
ncbi:MAG: PorT family protein [Mucilaginibacter sp.]|nr:PorT family protein [Mucilaginibacter sp.]